jgi:hypothetical protein
MILKAIET